MDCITTEEEQQYHIVTAAASEKWRKSCELSGHIRRLITSTTKQRQICRNARASVKKLTPCEETAVVDPRLADAIKTLETCEATLASMNAEYTELSRADDLLKSEISDLRVKQDSLVETICAKAEAEAKANATKCEHF
jgi:hypothetical protein